MDPQVLSQILNDSMFILPEAMLALFGLAILLTDFFLAPNQKVLERRDRHAGSGLQRRRSLYGWRPEPRRIQ